MKWYSPAALVLGPVASLWQLAHSRHWTPEWKCALLPVFLLMFVIGLIIFFLSLIDYCMDDQQEETA